MFGSNQMQSSNPALATDQDVFRQYYGAMDTARPETTTLQGVVNKTAIFLAIAVLAGAGGYAVAEAIGFGVVTISAIVSFIVAIGIFFKLRGNPLHAVYLGPVYAVVQGFFLGALTGMLEGILRTMNVAAAGGLAFQAFIITVSIMLAMLALYSLRILRPTRMFTAVISTLTVGIMFAYILSFLGGLIFGQPLPFISVFAGGMQGTGAWIGLGVNVLILGVAAMWLIIDFGLIEEKVNEGAPRAMEWYCAFALMVTLAWIYFEAVKLAFRLAVIFGGRE